MKKFYITTSIPYVNAAPHIGFALELAQADTLARYHRMMGYDTYFLAGSDDNAQKNAQVAEKQGIPTKQFVDQHAQEFSHLKETLNISYDQFFQTSQEKHFIGAQHLWRSFKKEDIYKKSYEGLYCVGCEQFYNPDDLVEGKFCPDHKTEVELVKEENYFFKLSNYQEKLEQYLTSGQILVVPEKRRNETLGWVKKGLEDFSISRPTARVKGWGVPVPNDPDQTMYVWVDALSNYITALGYGNPDDSLFKKYWPADIQVIGKGINRFHAIYWPAMLLSADIPTPKAIMIHDYVTVNGEKISKSLGNGIPPEHVTQKYGVDATRYYLLREIPTYSDGDYSDRRMEEIYSADLANELGNLVSRTIAMIHKYSQGHVPELPSTNIGATSNDTIDTAIRSLALQAIQNDPETSRYSELINQLELSKTLEHIWQNISECNKLINITEPWKLAKEGNDEKVQEVLYWLAQSIHNIAWELYPFLPETSLKIAKAFNIEHLLEEKPDFYNGIHEWEDMAPVSTIEPLFPKKETT